MRIKPAVFLDRDGVLTAENSYVCSARELQIFSYTKECIEQIHRKGYYAIVITNQSGIARGLFAEEELHKMNRMLMQETEVDAVYYCPHHPQGKVKKFAITCNCRKPQVGLFEKACRDFRIDLKDSFMVGDRAGDILAGIKMGIKTVLLESGYGSKNLEQDVKPDYCLEDLRKFVELLNMYNYNSLDTGFSDEENGKYNLAVKHKGQR